jgi:hypothetical protein
MRASGVVLLAVAACSGPSPVPDGGGPVDSGLPPDSGSPPSCGAGKTACDGGCSDLQLDPGNCGTCGHACGASQSCMAGACAQECNTGFTACSNSCVNLTNDKENCGMCGMACAPTQVCRMSACDCPAPTLQKFCNGACIDVRSDPNNCGDCGMTCPGGQLCASSQCVVDCPGAQTRCGPAPGTCHDLSSESLNCGTCGNACNSTLACVDGTCACSAGKANCGGVCINTQSDPQNCGGCGISCGGQPCYLGVCLVACGPGLTRCGTSCVDLSHDISNCNACGHACTGNTTCTGGQCVSCNSATTDCDGDGWLVSEGDCCDTPAACSLPPAQVNPGALEIDANGVDDNCNGLLDAADVLDLQPCDSALLSSATDGGDYAQAMDLCRWTVSSPTTPQQRTWGILSADLLKADGTPLDFPGAASIRGNYGVLMPQGGSRFAVFSTGLAADATQTNPGPNGGPATDPSGQHSTPGVGFWDSVDFSSCTSPACIKDWFNAARPPLKLAGELPSAAACMSSGMSMSPNIANDSVMLLLKLRAPTNMRAFQFDALFLSAEYPEYVCSAFNDQLLALVDTRPSPAVPNPPDKNLMTYTNGGLAWPVGINMAAGTDLFARCKPKASDPCWELVVDPQSCSLGDATLAGTGFDAPPGTGTCNTGGGSRWLTTTGNVEPGQLLELRIVIWDVDDGLLDSVALLDGFKWLPNPASPGTR